MEINWYAVLTGFVVAAILGLLLAFVVPITELTVFLLALPGLIGGFVAGYMVSGSGNGAVHGGLATVFGSLLLVAFLTIFGALFVGIVPAIGGAALALLALFVQAIPGAIAGAIGGWWKARRPPRQAGAPSP